jgi:hypothetical protein
LAAFALGAGLVGVAWYVVWVRFVTNWDEQETVS